MIAGNYRCFDDHSESIGFCKCEVEFIGPIDWEARYLKEKRKNSLITPFIVHSSMFAASRSLNYVYV